MSILVAGFALGLSLIVAIGPQNAYIIKMGIKRNHIGAIVLACALSDVILILAGTAGVGYLVDRHPMVLTVLKYAGVIYLAYFTYLCFRDAFKPQGEALVIEHTEPSDAPSTSPNSSSAVQTLVRTAPAATWVKPVLGAMALTWLNPAAYVDTLVMLGGIANQYGEQGRWVFAAGSICASFCWFPLVGFGSQRFAHVLARPNVWRGINFAIGCVMTGLTLKLLLH